MCNFSHTQNNESAMRLPELSEFILSGGEVVKVKGKISPVLNYATPPSVEKWRQSFQHS
jgi:hypothetical protein